MNPPLPHDAASEAANLVNNGSYAITRSSTKSCCLFNRVVKPVLRDHPIVAKLMVILLLNKQQVPLLSSDIFLKNCVCLFYVVVFSPFFFLFF